MVDFGCRTSLSLGWVVDFGYYSFPAFQSIAGNSKGVFASL